MEETISLKEIFEVLKKRLLLILVLMFGAAGISAIISYFVLTPTYESSSQFIVNQQSSGQSENVDINEIRSNVEIINTYNVIIKSTRILDQVVDELNLSISAGELGGKINVSSAQNSQVVTVTATDTDPETAAAIANTTVEVFQEDIPNLMNVNNVNVLTEAVVPADPQPVNPKPLLNIAIAIVLGAMVGVGLAFLLEYIDNTIKTESDIEKKLELPVLGVISHIGEDELATTHFNKSAVDRGGQYSGQTSKKTS